MNLLTRWFNECSNCLNSSSKQSSTDLSDYYLNLHQLAQRCFHISTKQELICEKCFIEFFLYDRFIIRQLFVYLTNPQDNYLHLKDLHHFAQKILHWHEFLHPMDFLLQLFHILLSGNFHRNSIDELIKDAFFFTTIQANVQSTLTSPSENFLDKFLHYFHQLNPNENYQTYFYLIKRILPWGLISIHKWWKFCFRSSNQKLFQSHPNLAQEFHSHLPLTFLWYLTTWLVSNKVFLHEYDPLVIFDQVSHQELITNLYDSDRHGYSIVTLSQSTSHLDGPFLLMFYCQDEKIFAILLEGKLMDSAKPYGGRSSLCLQLSPQFLILERGPSMLYWNIKRRSDGPLAIRIGHHGITRVSLDLNLEYLHHPEGSTRINRIQIYKFGPYQTPLSTPLNRQKSQHHEYNLFSIDAHKLAESIGIHLFT